MPSLFWAAGFSFSSSEAAIAVPYDDSLEFLFFGEESSMAARYWTHASVSGGELIERHECS